jgi:hypothetical protein
MYIAHPKFPCSSNSVFYMQEQMLRYVFVIPHRARDKRMAYRAAISIAFQ